MKAKATSSSSRSKRKATKAERSERRPRRRRQPLRIAIPRDARTRGIILLGAAGLIILSLLLPIDFLLEGWRGLLGLAFGWSSYAVPVLLAIFGLELVWSGGSRKQDIPARRMAGWPLLFLVSSGFLQLAAYDPVPTPAGVGGGYLGYALYHGLVAATGPVLTFLGLLLLLSVGCMMVLGISGSDLRLAVSNLAWALEAAFSWLGSLVSVSPDEEAPEEEKPPVRSPRRPVMPEEMETERVEAASSVVIRAPTLAAAPVADASVGEDSVVAGSPGVSTPGQWRLPPLTLLKQSTPGQLSETDLRQKVRVIESTLADFEVPARVVEVNQGPAVTQFGLEPGFREKRDRSGAVIKREKVKVSEITSLANDLALALAASTIRIEAPVPGRAVVGVEVPNTTAATVRLRGLLETPAFQRLSAKSRLAVALGQDVSGQAVVADLAKMPHLLIAGSTGSGKSVCINSIIACLLLHATPAELRLLMIDPKRVELSTFNDVPHLLRPVVVEVEKVVGVLKWVIREMEERYKKFELAGVRNLETYNRVCSQKGGREPLPYIVLLIDELADLMMTAPEEVERSLCRLAQLARATGIHLVIATQRPSVDVITGLIKANFPTRISFAVTSQVDSRTILDMPGAEKLLGRGDMLFMPTDAAKPIRLQGAYVSDDELEALVTAWKRQGVARYVEELVQVPKWTGESDEQSDELYDKAVELAGQYSRLSASLLQRKLHIGYARAARLMDMLEENGVVGASEGANSRETLAAADRSAAHETDQP